MKLYPGGEKKHQISEVSSLQVSKVIGKSKQFRGWCGKTKEPVNEVIKKKERKKDTSLIVAMLSINSHLLPSQKVEATQMSIHGHRRMDKQNVFCVFLGEISITSDMQMTPPLWQKVKRN